jgi:hypothetical protein
VAYCFEPSSGAGRNVRRILIALLLPVVLGAAAPARGTLGGAADSVEMDRAALSAVRRATVVGSSYSVQEIEVGATRVRQYLSRSGLVFGLAWNGLTHPDLDTLLGSHAAAWRAAEHQVARSAGRRFLTVAAPEVVVEKWGRMRNLQGRAYAPALLPPGVSIDEIR